VSLPLRVLTRADCPVSLTNATNTGGQIALWRLTDRLQVTLTRHKQQASLNELSGALTKLQLSWNNLFTTLLELVMLVYTRITHFRQCCNYNLLPAMYGRVLSLLSVRFFGYIISRRRWHRSAWNFARWYVSRIIDVSSPLLGEVPPWDPQIQNPVWRVLCFSDALVILLSHSLLPFTSLTLSLSSLFFS